MSTINTNVTALTASRILNMNNASLKTALQRLSTGLRINSGADDPAGLIASENLRADKAAIGQAIKNAERASSIVGTAEGALNEVSDKLIKLQELVSQAASSGGLSDEEIAANQVQVDGIVSSINRIAGQTSFQGRKLLDGSMDFNATNGADGVQDLVINAAKLGDADALSAVVTINTVAAQAVGGTAIGSSLTTACSIQVTGAKGTEVFSFAASATQAQIEAAINGASATTGVVVNSAHKFTSTDYGTDGFVKVEVLSGSGITAEDEEGTDADITINGMKASVTGYKVSLRTSNLSLDFNLKKGALATEDGTITITGGGAAFNLSPNAGLSGKEVIGIQSMSAVNLGTEDVGHLSDITAGQKYDLATDASKAQDIVGAAIKQVASLRGRLGSFMNDTVDSTINSLQISLENVSAAESAIRDTDFATETANLTRNQILVSAATSVLSIANSAPQAVLNLLR